jgi:hypothetical protein
MPPTETGSMIDQAEEPPPGEKPVRSEAASAGAWPDVPAAKPLPWKFGESAYGCAAIVVFAAVIVLAPVGYLAYAWYDLSQPPGLVPPEKWPFYLHANHAAWQKAGLDVDGMEVFGTDPMFNDAAYARVRYTPETWEHLKRQYAGGDSESVDAARESWEQVRRELPEWAPDLNHPGVELLPLSGRYGDEGEHTRIAYDPGRQMIYIDYYFNF